MRKQYYGYLLEEYDRIRPADHWRIDQAFDSAVFDGDWQPLVKTVSEEYEKTCAESPGTESPGTVLVIIFLSNNLAV